MGKTVENVKIGTSRNTGVSLPKINGISLDEFEKYANTLAIRKPVTQEQADKNVIRNYELLPLSDSRKQSMSAAYTTALENEAKRQTEKDNKLIYDYESIPEYNVFERIFDKDKRTAYNTKQTLLDAYNTARDRQIGNYLNGKNIGNDLVKSALAYDPSAYSGGATEEDFTRINAEQSTNKKAYDILMDAMKDSQYTLEDIENYNYRNVVANGGMENLKKLGDQNKVAGTAISLGTNLFGSIPALLDTAKSYIKGAPIDGSKDAYAMTNATGALREGVQEDMNNVGKLLYGVGTSIGDMGLAGLVTGGTGGTTALLGMESAASTIQDSLERGLNPTQTAGTAALSGIFEAAFEKISLGNLKTIIKGGKAAQNVAKPIVSQLVKQVASEAGEEMGTEIANEIADRLLNQNLSHFVLRSEEYQKQGMSEDDAKKQAWKDVGNQIVQSGLAGAISGGILGGGASVFSNITSRGQSGAASDSNTIKEPGNDMNVQKGAPTLNTELPFVKESLNVESTDNQSMDVLSNTQNNHSNKSTQRNEVLTNQQQGEVVRGYNETFTEKTDAPQELKDEFIDNPRMYNRLHNADTKAKADAILQENDTNTAVNEYYTLLNQKDPAAVPLGYNLSKQLLNEGRKNEAVRVIDDMSKALTESGQFSQAAAITMLNNDPDAAKIMMMRKIDSMNEAGQKKFGKKWSDFELSEEEQQLFDDIEVGDSEAIEDAYQQVFDRISREYPSTFKDKLMEYRRVAMLLNVRTNVRNVVSNALMLPVRWTGDRVAALGEGVYSLINPDYERTQSINPFRSKQTREIATEAWEQVKDTILDNGNKYEDTKDAIRNRQVFKGSKVSQVIDNITNGAITKANQAMGKNNDPSLLETARNFTYWLLEKGDNVFVQANFKSRMMSYLNAQGITSIDDIPADAYTLAAQEAMKATFKDDTKLSKVLSEIKRNTGIVGEVVLPFTKTPANLAMRGIDYSPAGLAEAGYKLKNAKSHAEVAEAMTLFGQSATGSAAILLGMVLAESGLISGALSDDKDEAAFQKQQGMLPYAIKVGDNYYSYDWAQPAAIPLILGATIYQAQEDSESLWNGLGQGTIAAADSWLELSPLQNLSDIFGGYGTPAENVADVLMQFPLSFIPAQLGAATRIGDTAQRTTYDNASKLEIIKNQAMAKIPGLSELLPLSYDTWGNPINRQDTTGEAAFANLINPGQFGNSNVTPLDGEITRLFDSTGENSVFPKKADWSQKIGGETIKLDNEQYSEYQKIMGEKSYDMVGSLMKSSAYSSLSDAQKVDVIGDMYNFANALAKSELLGYDVANVDTYRKTYEIYEEKGSQGVSEYYTIKQFMNGSSNAEKISAVERLDLSEEDKGYYLSKLVTVSKKAQQAFDQYGYSGLYNWYKIYSSADSDGNGSVTKDEMSQAVQSSNLPFVDQVVYMQIYGGK